MSSKSYGLDGVAGNVELGKGGPRLKDAGGVVEARNSGDTTYAVVRGGEPSGASDLATKNYVDTEVGQVEAYIDLIEADRKEPTGFPYAEQFLKSQISFDNGLRRFTIEPKAPFTSYRFWVQGVPYTKSAAETIDITDTEGLHVIYYDVGGTLAMIANPTDAQVGTAIREKALCAWVYWDADSNAQIYFANERHGVVMDGIDHEMWHWRFGAYLLSGGTLATIAPDESGDLDAHAQFGAVTSLLLDEDLTTMALPVASTVGLPVFWRSGAAGNWRKTVNAGFSVLTTGTGRMAWNEWTGAVWQQTELTNGDYALAHVFLTNDNATPFVAVMGQARYTTLGAARVGATTEMNALILSGIPAREWTACASVIFQTSNTYANAVKARVRTTDDGFDYVSWINSGISPSSGAIQLHNDLDGLNDGDYQHLTAANATQLTTNVQATNHWHLPDIVNHRTVGQVGSECDFTPTLGYGAIYAAVLTAIAGGASASNPWLIDIYPGVYAEPKITLPAGVYLRSTDTRMDTVFVAPVDPTDDLFVMAGGWMSGLHLVGVTSPGKFLVNCSVEGSFTALHNVSIHGCYGGISVLNGAQVIATNLSMLIGGASMDIGVGVYVNGVGAVGGGKSYFAAAGMFAAIPDALLPLYTSNPIQRVLSVTGGAEGFVTSGSFRVASKDNTADVIFVDDGGFAFVSGAEMNGCETALHIGSVGTGSKILTQGGNFTDNDLDIKIEAATGRVFVSQSVDVLTTSLVAGAEVVGMVQNRDDENMAIIGKAKYQYLSSGRQVDLADFFADYTSTGVCDGGVVTHDTGLYVDVTLGDGWCRRPSPNDDAKWVVWADTNLLLTASQTNYVYVNGSTGVVEDTTSVIGYGDNILLAIVVTDGSTVRFLHQARNYLTGPLEQIRSYLLATRKQALATGLICTQGTGVRNIDVAAGSYYLGLDLISYAGDDDAVWSYFYGTNGATEVASVTQVNITQYDNAGTLTAMTGGYFRSDTLLLTSDGRLSLIYGTAQYATQPLAEAAVTGNTPTFIEHSVFPLYRVIVQEAVGIVSFVDIRPQPASGGGSGGGAGVTDHGALTGLADDDHSQYLLASGSRSMSGDLNMGTQNITNVGNVDGVDVSAHAGRHLPGGADALSVATPVAIGTANAEGDSANFVRGNHVHDHGAQTSGTLHAAASTTVAGFLSAAGKTHLDACVEGPVSAVVGNIATFSNVSGKVVADSGTKPADFAAASHAHDDRYFTETELGSTTALSEGALLIGTDTKTNLGSATTVEAALTSTDSHVGNTSNPHATTKAQVGLTNVTDDAQVTKATLTTKGDIISASAASTPVRVGVGTNGYPLIGKSGDAAGVAFAGTGDTVNVGTGYVTQNHDGASATVLNIYYGTTDPPGGFTATPHGTIYIKHSA